MYTPPTEPTGQDPAAGAGNRGIRRRLRLQVIVCAAIFGLLGLLLVVSIHGKVDVVVHERTLGPTVEVTALPNDCTDGDDCVTELVNRRGRASHRQAWVAEDLEPGTIRSVRKADTTGGVELPETCCRDDIAYPVGTAMLLTGVLWLVASLRPPSPSGTARVAPSRFALIFPSGAAGLLGAAVGTGVHALDLQPRGTWAFSLVHVLPTAATVLLVAAVLWRRRVVIEPDALAVTSPVWRRRVRLGADTEVRLRRGIDGAVRKVTLDDGHTTLSLWVGLWSDDDGFRRQLFTTLASRGVTGELAELLRPPDLSVNLRAVGGMLRRQSPG